MCEPTELAHFQLFETQFIHPTILKRLHLSGGVVCPCLKFSFPILSWKVELISGGGVLSSDGVKMEEINRLLDIRVEECLDLKLMEQTIALTLARGHQEPPLLRSNHPAPEVSPDYEERINYSSKLFQWIPFKPEWLQKLRKNNGVSGALRTKGNAFFGKRDLQEALKLYNLAILFAEPTCEELGLAFANRSALLLEQKDPKGGLKDIGLALKNNYPERLMPKLEKRREKFVAMLEDIERSHLIEDIKSDMARRRKFRDEELLKLKNPSPTIPCAENFVEIEYTEEAGRQLVVTKDVPVGTVLIVEQPFTAVNEEILTFDAGQHCDNCWKFVKNGIPCKSCVFVIYCNDWCRSNAEFGSHKFECNCLSSLYVDSTDTVTHQAFRIVCKVGPEELYRLFTTRDPRYFGLKKPFGTEQGYKYESDSYLPIHHLLSHTSELDEDERYGNGLKALQLVSILEARTPFFELSPNEKRHDFKNFVAAILLRSMEMIPTNAVGEEVIQSLHGFTLADVYLRKEVQAVMKEALRSGSNSFFGNTRSSGIYSVGSLMKHSCDPSVIRVHGVSHGTMVVVTTRGMKKGEPITTSYGVGFKMSSLSDRKLYLKTRYHFNCLCIACENDWPTDAVLQTKDPEFTCPSCSKKFSQEEKECGEFLKCCLRTGRATCRLCGKSYKIGTLYEGYSKAMAKYNQGFIANLHNRPFEALKASREVAEYFQFNIRPPHGFTGSNQYALEQALALILHFAE